MPKTSVNVVFKVSTQNIKKTSASNLKETLSLTPATARKARELFKHSNWKFETGFEESSDVNIQIGKLLPNLRTWFASVCGLESYIRNPFDYELTLVVNVMEDKYPLTLINEELIEFASLAGMKVSVETKLGDDTPSSREDQRTWTNVEFAAFSLNGRLDPAVISSALGFEPSIMKKDCWSISSGFWLTSKAESLVEETLKPLLDKTEELLELKAEYGMAYRLIITMDTDWGLVGKVSLP
ncbi:MAG: hypothetical protein LBT59_28530, partial [Clostridiales bacterium]|nr:hypothetical protein [Clostridiales bacterium]